MLCCEILGPDIHMDFSLTHTIYLILAANLVYPFTKMALPEDSGHFQLDNASCQIHKLKLVLFPLAPQFINLFKHLCDVLEKQFKSMEASLCNLQDLKDLLRMAWCQIPKA